ncbi:MAG: DUF4342 domain-containing protein [Candidatus Bathyarchaeia archaeon]
MVTCSKCGFRLPTKANYCPNCGFPARGGILEEMEAESDQLVRKVKELLHEGNIRRIIVRNEKGEVLLEIPATVGVVGAILAPWLAALGAIAAIATRCKITVERGRRTPAGRE